MKMKIVIATFLLFNVAIAALGGNPVEVLNFIERKKTIVKLYDVNAKETLHIDNRYGDVQVVLWDKSSIRIDITITANASSESRVNDILNSVKINDKVGDNQISVKTTISSPGNRVQWAGNSLRIDYLIQMPERTPLNLKNSFGDTDIVRFLAPLTVETEYGTFRARDLENKTNTIMVRFGNAQIGQMQEGRVDSRYSEVKLDKVHVLELVNKFGSLNIGEVASLNADIGYSGTKIGSLKERGIVKLQFSDAFSIGELTAENVDIDASYSSIVLPAKTSSKFDVKVTYGNFQYPPKTPMVFIKQPSGNTTKEYEGVIGHEDPKSVIKVNSRFGNVKLK